jgi:hypothetical protein
MGQNSGITFPVIFFIVLPFISASFFVLINFIPFYIISNGFYSAGVTTSEFIIKNTQVAYFFSYLVPYLNYIVLPIGVVANVSPFIYVIYSAFLNMEKYSRKKGSRNIVIEFELVKKLIIIYTSLLVLSIILLLIIPEYFKLNIIDDYFSKRIGYIGMVPLSFFFLIALGPLISSDIAIFLRILTLIGKSEFRFYYAKGCCELFSKDEDNITNMKYLNLLFNSYNKYLRRHTKFEIKDVHKISSSIMYADKVERSNIINSICISLDDNRLGLPRLLGTLCKVPENDLFVRESLLQQLKIVGTLLAAAITIVIYIIEIIPKVITEVIPNIIR